jgi:subtilisin family serine protease
LARGEVRVLVRLNTTPSQSKTPSVARAADEVTRAYAHRSPRSFDAIPYLSMTIDGADLAMMQNDPRIAGVYEDRQNEVSLDQSTMLIGATQSWAAGYTGAGQSVAILDTGFDTTHPMLQGKAVAEACFSSTLPAFNSVSLCPNGQNVQIGPGAAINCNPFSGGSMGAACQHGTHVAGIAIGSSAVLSGVASGANLVGVQVFSKITAGCSSSPCVTAWDSDILAGLNQVYKWRSQYNIAAVNLSLGGGVYSSQFACDVNGQAYRDIFALFNRAGIPVVVASGNGGSTSALSMPACITGAISAGATTKDDAIPWFSNSADFLLLLAPGNAIKSAVPSGGIGSMSGTSMAAPHIAGAFAVLKSKLPNAGVLQVYEALESTGVPIVDTRAGAGNRMKKRIALMNALNALDTASWGDANEPDDSPALARPITTSLTQTLRFGVPDDRDWLVLQAQANHIYRIETLNISAATDTILEVYDNVPGAMPAALNDDADPGIDRRSILTYTTTTDGPIFLQVRDWNAGAFLNTQYDVLVTQVGIATPAPTVSPSPTTPTPSPTVSPTPEVTVTPSPTATLPIKPKFGLYLPVVGK